MLGTASKRSSIIMKTAITISINVKPRFAAGQSRPTGGLADSRTGEQRRIGQVTPCAPNHKTARKTGVSPVMANRHLACCMLILKLASGWMSANGRAIFHLDPFDAGRTFLPRRPLTSDLRLLLLSRADS